MKFGLVLKNILTFLSLFIVTSGYSQEEFRWKNDYYTSFKNISVNDGLSANLVLDILQDKYGIMWFATANGLTRYDGNLFTVYQTQKENEHSISDNFVTSLAEDSHGNLWIGTHNGLNKYDRQKNRFIRYLAYKSNKNGLQNNLIKALHADKEGHLWIESISWLSKLDTEKEIWSHRHHPMAIFEGDYFYHHIFEDSKNNLWLGGRGTALTKVPNKNLDSMSFFERPLFEASSFTETPDGNLYFTYYNQILMQYNPLKDSIEIILDKTAISPITSTCDKNGNLWLGGEGGIAIINPRSKDIIRLEYNPSNTQSIISNKIHCLYKDRNDCIWIGTDRGVSMYSPNLNIFRHYRHLNKVENGMTSNAITALLEDKDGLIWVSTASNGVDTFSLSNEKFGNLTYNLLTQDIDKKTFDREKKVLKQYFRHKLIKSQNIGLKEDDIFQSYEHFKQASLQFSRLNENRASSLYEDKKGKIYIGLWSHVGFNAYDKKQKVLKRHALWGVPTDSPMPFILEGNPFGANWYGDFLEDNKGNFWVATWEATGLNLFDREKGEFAPKHYVPGYLPRKHFTLHFIHDSIRQRMFLNHGSYYGYYNLKAKSFNRYSKIIADDYINSEIFKQYSQYSKVIFTASFPKRFEWRGSTLQDSIVWIVSHDRLLKHILTTDEFETIETYSKDILDVTMVKGINKQIIWLSRGNTLAQLNTQTNQTKILVALNEAVTSLCEEKNGTLWIGTKRGIYFFDTKKEELAFSNMNLTDIKAIAEDRQGYIYVASSNGLTQLENRTIKAEYPFTFPESNGLPGSIITCVYVGSYIWIGTNDGLARLNPKTNEVAVYVNDPKDRFSLITNNIIDLCEDGDLNLWISTVHGFCMLEHNSGKFIDLSVPDDKTLASRLAICLMQDNQGNIWVGTTEEGISVLNPKTDRLTHYNHQSWNDKSLSDGYIHHMFQDSRQNIWICTRKGLNKYNPNEDNFDGLDQLNGYSTYNMQEDNSGNLWLSTNNGLFCLNPSGQIIRKYHNFPGLQGNEFGLAGCKLSNGNLAFGGNSGFNIFNPESLANNQFQSKPIIFSNLIVKDSVRYFDLNGLEGLNLSHNDNTFSITFSSADYEYPDMISYRYKLDGVDDSWSYTKAPILTAKYNSVPYGRHTFIVEVSSCFGEWVGITKTLAVYVATPWYYQWWFFILLAAFFAGIVYAIVQLREKQLKLENVRLENTVEERTSELKEANQKLMESEKELRAMNDSKNKFFSIISHDLRNPLKALNLTTSSLFEQYDKLAEEEKYNIISIIHKTTQQTGVFVENLLTWVISQMNMLKPNLKKTELSSLLNSNIEFMQIEAQKKNICLNAKVPYGTYVWADENLLSTIFRNLISNAIHYSFPGSEITISSKEKNSCIEVSVADQGVGISEENLKRIFSLDAKVQTKGTGNEKGTGLGLIITQEFVSLHKGKIWVESIVNKGSTFIFTLQKFTEDDGAN